MGMNGKRFGLGFGNIAVAQRHESLEIGSLNVPNNRIKYTVVSLIYFFGKILDICNLQLSY
jgi:hypothetical protein